MEEPTLEQQLAILSGINSSLKAALADKTLDYCFQVVEHISLYPADFQKLIIDTIVNTLSDRSKKNNSEQ